MERKKNPDRWFAAATMKHVEELAALMGKNNVAIISKDERLIFHWASLLLTGRAPFL